MSDWEDMVNKVCVAGRSDKVKGLALDWQAVFYNAATVSKNLRDGLKDLQDTWKGPAADDYREKIESIAKAIEQIEEDNKSIITMLQTAGDALATAQAVMPVPDYMLNEVQNRRAELDNANQAGARAMLAMDAVATMGVSVVAAFLLPDSFMKPLADSFVGNWGRELFGHFRAWWDDWDGKMTAEAKRVYDQVDTSYASADIMTPSPTQTKNPLSSNMQGLDFNTGGGSGTGGLPHTGTGGLPHTGTGGLHPDSTKLSPSTHEYPRTGTGGTGHVSPGYGSDAGAGGYHPTTGLAGAGGSPLTGAGGTGSAGLGSGASGLGSAVGKAVSPTGMPGFGGGMGGMGAGGRRAGGAGRGAMGAGGHGGGGGHAPDDEHGTWLTEDEDVWGANSGAPPGVLGG
ncbi:MAG: hypothetical protein QOE61_974 [Micromonosporaceae bacterium]|nr:hypothetical protein [Micromonosporaceae bacterium]